MQIRSLVHGPNGRLRGGQERWCGEEGGGGVVKDGSEDNQNRS